MSSKETFRLKGATRTAPDNMRVRRFTERATETRKASMNAGLQTLLVHAGLVRLVPPLREVRLQPLVLPDQRLHDQK